MPRNQSQSSRPASLSAAHASASPMRGQPRIDTSVSEQTAARTSRLSENKRRHRARRKEYVADLERRLAESRQHGVQATREVQLAAQLVDRENASLRQLLNLAGFRHEEISAWLRLVSSSGEPGPAWRACVAKARDCARHHAASQGATTGPADARLPSRLSPVRSTDDPDGEKPSPSSQDRAATGHTPPTRHCTPCQPERSCPSVASPSFSAKMPSVPRVNPPCRLLSYLEQNPGADLTQVPVNPGDTDAVLQIGDGEVGVECGRAYEMLMRYATTEDKMDTIAQALEAGCKPDGGGRCAVKREVVWQVLDGMCG
ncbi:hypothetical protein Micbo1qcDRAFT_158423 [Microdochium bolleyi]|uniref:BZIP domain-containing protein n=1 Tax=Microdochium bolleyi TaxID=196109 RepID=A0A136JGE0_9PEZI|nr:hypothetical protein Micbo1qcDRAFT_158423 [Microdochium bolleyi]